jgi:hypothetical protein
MSTRVVRHTVFVLMVLGFVASGASAQLPPEPMDVVYRIHDNPNDPDSAIVFTVMLSLEAQEADENSIGWQITEIRFRQPGQNGDPDTIWIESDPDVPTQDGLWWVDHADRENPQLDEFDEPPHLVGIAAAADPNATDLKYDFEGVGYTPGSGGPPWDVTAALDYKFKLDGQSSPLESGTDEPVEIDDDDDDPPAE